MIDNAPPAPPYGELVYRDVPPRRRRPGLAIGWILLVLGVAGAVIVAMLPSPYVVERPGPVYDTLGDVQIEGKKVPVIDIPNEPTFPTEGSLDLLTVSIFGSPDNPLSWLDVAVSWFDRSRAVVPSDLIYPPGTTTEQSDEQGAQEMQNSQQEAIAAALRELGYTVPGIVTVTEVVDGLPADGVLEVGDVIVSADGTPVQDVTALREIIAGHGTDSAVVLVISRGGVESTVSITPQLGEVDSAGTKAPLVGIGTGASYDFPVEVKIQLENVGGPSAGMMFALGIIDKLTPDALTGGERIAGTGTIAADGTVGPIGGIRQKMFGAVGAGADWFLAPEANCDEVTGHIPDGLTVFSIGDLDDARAAVEAIGSGADTSSLATCPTG